MEQQAECKGEHLHEDDIYSWEMSWNNGVTIGSGILGWLSYFLAPLFDMMAWFSNLREFKLPK